VFFIKKNILVIIILIIVVISIVFGCVIYKYQTKTITSFFHNDTSKITRITIMNSGGNIITVNDKKIISNISDYLSKLKFKRISNKPLSVGWSYMFSFYEKDTEMFGFASLGDSFCTIKGNRYSVINSTNVTIESLYDEAKKVSK
jgi:hypothetical protein